MTREEAIKIIEENRLYYRDWKQGEFDKALERLKESPTLCDFLGLEEGQEYEYGLIKYKLEKGRLMQYFDDPYRKGWTESRLLINNIGILRQAKKVERPKPKAWRVRDEYSFKCLIEELKGLKYKNIDYDWLLIQGGDIVIYDDKNEFAYSNYNYFSMKHKDNYNLIEYHKEEPKYYAKIKGWEVFEDDGYYWNYDEGDKWFYIGSKWGTQRTKTQWAELGIGEDNAEFEKVEVGDE